MSEQLQKENEAENFCKQRTSPVARFKKTPKFLLKTDADNFQIRNPLNIYITEELKKLGRRTYFQRVYILAKNIDEDKLKEHSDNLNLIISGLQQPDFRTYFQHQIDEIFATCKKKRCTQDNFSGIFIAMGTTHSYLMIEGAEDMVANFFEEIDLIHDRIWVTSRIFLVEDRIGVTHFNTFYSRHSAAINTNETFPTSTTDDYNLMVVHHLNIKEKLFSLTEALAVELNKWSNAAEASKNISTDLFDLPADPFNKLMPDVQRIDLVLHCHKFYRTVKDFSQTYRLLQTHHDEDAFLWPIQNSYTPLDVFKRSEFDVNLTFRHYGEEEKKENHQNATHGNS